MILSVCSVVPLLYKIAVKKVWELNDLLRLSSLLLYESVVIERVRMVMLFQDTTDSSASGETNCPYIYICVCIAIKVFPVLYFILASNLPVDQKQWWWQQQKQYQTVVKGNS